MDNPQMASHCVDTKVSVESRRGRDTSLVQESLARRGRAFLRVFSHRRQDVRPRLAWISRYHLERPRPLRFAATFLDAVSREMIMSPRQKLTAACPSHWPKSNILRLSRIAPIGG